VNRERIIEDLRRDEGVKLKPYLCTAGAYTIGVGRNLDDVGITVAEAIYMLHNDVDRCCLELDQALAWGREPSEARQRALVNMCFNLGITRLMGFKSTLKALQECRFDEAAHHATQSRWAVQVGARATRIAELIRKG